MRQRQQLKTLIPALMGLAVLILLIVAVKRGGPPAGPQVEPDPVARTMASPPAQVERAGLAEKAEAGPLPNFDFREDPRNRSAWSESRQMVTAWEDLRRTIPDLTIERDPVTGTPKWIASSEAWLTGPAGSFGPDDAVRLTREYLEKNRELFGHGPEPLDEAREVSNYTHDRSTSRKVIWHQRYQGIEVFEAVLQANFTGTGELMNIGSQFVPRPGGAVGKGGEKVTATLAVEKAVAIAGQSVGERITADSIRPTAPPAASPDRRQQFRAALITDADARLTWLPTGPASMVLTWDVTLTSPSRSEMYRVLVDAGSGKMLLRQSLTAYNDSSFRVYTSESPTPMSPGHEFPSSLQPAAVSRTLETLTSLNPVASPDGWINAGINITSGNNADAYTDTDANNAADLPRTTGSPSRVFDFPLNDTQEPANFKDASVTQLFYWTNFMHDRMYSLGFTEPAGNFQVDNFGRGGFGGDPVNAEAQDGSGTNNANFSTPTDGSRGRMQMYNWTAATPDRDGSFEAEVVLHEYGHGVSNRLVGGPSVSIVSLSTRGMGEGWSDFYGLALTAEEGDNPHGNWARGGWSRYLTSGWLSENYYFGARRYSYSTDMRKNPLTLKDIDPTQIDLHTDVPRNPTFIQAQDATQVHYMGTVWCTALWEMRTNLILKHGFTVGNERALFLVTEGMKLGPANPNFLQARDGIIQATSANHPGDRGEVWSAFAKRGMGHLATAPTSTTTTGIVETYAVPDSLEIVDRSGWNITGNVGGPFSPATKTLGLRNDGTVSVNWTSSVLDGWVTLSPSSGTISPGATVYVVATAAAEELKAGFHSTNVIFTNPATGFNQPLGVRLYVKPPVYESFNLTTNPGWTTTGQWAYGAPTGSGGTANGSGNDPTSGATGPNVYGVNLNGAVSTAIGGPFYLTTPPIDLSSVEETRLRFRRWLNTNSRSNTLVTVEISLDGVNWREVFANPGSQIRDYEWQTMEYDISSVADRAAAVSFRWGYRNLTSTAAYSGWNIDDIEILGQSSGRLSLDLAATAVENAGTISGVVFIDPPQAEPVVVDFASSDTGSATVTPTVTLAPGEASRSFTVTLIDNAILDGSRTTQISASATTTNTAVSSLEVTDNESATITIGAPAWVLEGDSGSNGSVRISVAPTRSVVVGLNSNNPSLVVPASVVIPAGSAGPVSFPLNAPNNAVVDGPRSVTLSATVPGWTPGTVPVTVNDDDSPFITLTGPTGGREGDGNFPFVVRVNTIQSTPRTLNLSSSDTSELTVPATVTISAGASTANFFASMVDDAVADGTQVVTITAGGPTFPNATKDFAVADNEVAQYTFSPIAVSQLRDRAFTVSVTARDVNGAVITNHSGNLNLTSNSAAGPVEFSPSVISGFNSGVGSLSISFSASGTGITLKATDSSGRSVTSNAFTVAAGPVLIVEPDSVSLTLTEDSTAREIPINLANPGSSQTNWSVVTILPTGPVDDPILPEALVNLNDRYTAITNIIPNRYQFTDGQVGNHILDGGLNMYDAGNFLGTNLTGAGINLPYRDNLIATSANLGTGGQYFTRKYPGLFVFGGDVSFLSYFEITGGLGADGLGSRDMSVITVSRGNRVYKGFVKRVFGASNPSVNHLIIIQDNGTATHTSATSTNDDYHRVSGLSGVDRIYCLIYAASSGGYINDTSTRSIMEAFLDALGDNSWLNGAPESGLLNAGQQGQLTATVDPRGLAPGNYLASLRFLSNDPIKPSQDVPFSLTVRPGIDTFEWSGIPSPQQKDVPFQATLSARDSGGALVDSFEGTVSLTAMGAIEERITGTGSATLTYPFSGAYYENRVQSIYAPSQVGGAGRLESLSFNVASVPGALNNFTIRLKHTLKPDYSAVGSDVWESEGWTTVFSGRLNVAGLGWMKIPFSQYFNYDGASSLMVDFSFDNTGAAIAGAVTGTTGTSSRTLYAGAFGSSGSPLQWSGTLPAPFVSSFLTNLNFGLRKVVPCLPQSVTFSEGNWTGDLRVGESVVDAFMSARYSPRPEIAGDSNPFDVGSIGSLSISAPIGGIEGEVLNASVSVPEAAAAARTVNLTSSDTTEVIVPASVVIPAGETSVAFNITLPDDDLLDLGQTATISAKGDFYEPASVTINVGDVETTTLSLSLPASVNEGGAVQGTVSITGIAGGNLSVSLVSSSNLLGVPSGITIPAGQSSAVFSISGLQNNFIEEIGGDEVTITASLPGVDPAEAAVVVFDNESRQITLNLPVTSISEGAAPPASTSRVVLAGNVRSAQTINLSSSDLTELSVPASVTVAAGSSQSEFVTVTPVDDTEVDGPKVVTVTAAATGFVTGTRNVTVLDNEAHHFTVSPVVGPVYRGVGFPVTFTARDANGNAVTSYTGNPVISAMDGAEPVAVSPTTASPFVNGVCTVSASLQNMAANAILTLIDPANGASGSSNGFAVISAPAVRLDWSVIPSPQVATQPFPVTLTAVNGAGETVTDFAGAVTLRGVSPAADRSIGTGISSETTILNTSSESARSQFVYLPSELGSAKVLTGLSLNVNSLPSRTLSKFTIRLKHTTRSTYSVGASFENDLFTTVYTSASEPIAATGWRKFTFQIPFAYNGTSNLLVDMTFDNSGSGTAGSVRSSSVNPSRKLYAANNRSAGFGDPLAWTLAGNATSVLLPNIIWHNGLAEIVTPSTGGAFTDGVWSGNVSVPNGGRGVTLVATSGNIPGISNPFDVDFWALPPILAPEPAFTGGTSNEIVWPPPGQRDAQFRVERSLSPAFTSPVQSSWSATNGINFTGLPNDTTYHYRAQSRLAGEDPVQVVWSQTSQSDFEANTLVGIDLANSPGSAGIVSGGAVLARESFDSAAVNWSETIFTRKTTSPNVFYTTEVTPTPAPVTNPLLPISADADREGVINLNGAGAIYTLQNLGSPNEVPNGSITASLYPQDSSKLIHGGLILRSSGFGTTLNGYMGTFLYDGTSSFPIWMGVTKITNGVQSTLVPGFGVSSFDPATQHVKIQLSADGSTITGRIWRVSVVNGVVTETLLGTGSGTDTAYSTGVSGVYISGNMVFDDVVIRGPELTSATMTSSLIGPADPARWGTLSYSRTVPTGSTVSVDVLSATGAVLATNVASGTNLGSLSALAGNTSIRLRANLSRTSTAALPRLNDWSVQYFPERQYHYSEWSNVVFSRQDATPPAISVGPPLRYSFVADASVIGSASDTISGVGSVTARGLAAVSSDQFANWTLPVVNLQEGSNQVTIVASDNAVPPNTASAITTIYRITDPGGDSNGNGISNLLEYAFGIPVSLARPEVAMPKTTQSVNPATGEYSFTMEYRRRIARNGIFYQVETSADLGMWGTTTATVQELSVLPTGDGVTEKVTVKVTSPEFNGTTKGFIRLNVRLE